MRILQINAVYGIRSTGRTTKETHNFLLENGVESYVAYVQGESVENGYIIGTHLDHKIHGLLSRATGLQGYYSRNSTRKFLKYLSKIKPDIIHIRNIHSNFINLPILFKFLKKNNIKTIVTLHDCWFYTGGHTHYTLDNFYDWKTEFENRNRIKDNKKMGNPSWFFDRSKKIFFDQVDWFSDIENLAFVGVSNWITKEAEKSVVTRNANLLTIYNWIDIDVFKPYDNNLVRNQYKLKDEFIILGVASKWTQKKGLNKFIELADFLSDDEKIILVGNIDSNVHLPSNLINIAETNNLKELANIYSISDVFLNLSIEETFGKVSAEAMACGTPVISNNFTANPEVIGENCGYILNDLEVEEIIKKYKRIKRKNKTYYSLNCIQYARQNYSMEKNLNKYLKLYENL